MSLQLDDSSGLQFAKNFSPRELWLLVETFHFGTYEILIASWAWDKTPESPTGFKATFCNNCGNSCALMG